MPELIVPAPPTLADIQRFEEDILKLPQVIFPIRHIFSPGMVAREMFIPKGSVLTGAVHKHAHLVAFDGDITVWTPGAETRFTGHQVVASLPGAKRAGFAHEDTYCTGYFLNPDDETDISVLEARLVEDSHLLQGKRALENEGVACLE